MICETCTLQGTNIYYLRKRKPIFPTNFGGNMSVSRSVGVFIWKECTEFLLASDAQKHKALRQQFLSQGLGLRDTILESILGGMEGHGSIFDNNNSIQEGRIQIIQSCTPYTPQCRQLVITQNTSTNHTIHLSTKKSHTQHTRQSGYL